MPRHRSDALLQVKLEEAKRLDAEIRKLKNAARNKQRALDDERRKIIGRVIMAYIKAHPDDDVTLAVNRVLSAAITKASERSLFPELSLPGDA